MTDTWSAFLAGTFTERLRMVGDDRHAAELRERLGPDAFAQYQGFAAGLDEGHLGDVATNLVFVPGVMGSLLSSDGYGGVWWLDIRSRNHINDLRLAPGGRGDADPRARIKPFAVDLSYEGFFAGVHATTTLRHEAFAYDWRKSLAESTGRFAERVTRISDDLGGRPVHVVAHSMGGLMVRTALAAHPQLWSRIDRIVFVGTPHYGAPVIAGYLKNHLWGWDALALLGRYLDRDTFRSLWGVLGLLPAPAGVYPGTRDAADHPCANFDLYDASAWHLGLDLEAEHRLQGALDAARAQHEELYRAHLDLDQERRDRMAVIAGVGYRTLFRTAYKPAFGFGWEHMDRVTSRRPGDPHRDGDGRVPLASARLEYVAETRYVRGEHGRLPSIPAVYDDAFRFLAGKPMQLPRTPQEALAGHLGGDGTADAADGDDPGYLDLSAPDLDALDEALENGRFPSFRQVRLL
ncbi:alpha/beta hydrolase [Dactylosporangium darangshiense]|uniref:Alpha/beta hydrolase n=1 Tax=Dactylosporangium darangshiense TaxID=579108 RepID=A0ABP8DJ33_9ACTN